MKNYDPYYPGFFETTEKEIRKQPKVWERTEAKHSRNVKKLRSKYGSDITEMCLRKLPYKKNHMDAAFLLIIRKESGKYFAKRYNNSQHLFLDR